MTSRSSTARVDSLAVVVTTPFVPYSATADGNQALRQLNEALPLALAPICNRPAIDYIIENLIQNKIHTIVVLTDVTNAEAVGAHVMQRWAHACARGIRLVAATSAITSLYDALQAIQAHDVASQHFMLVPIDAITTVHNLEDLFQRHVERVHAEKQIVTAVVKQDDGSLRRGYAAVMREAARHNQRQMRGTGDEDESAGGLAREPSMPIPLVTNTTADAFQIPPLFSDDGPSSAPGEECTDPLLVERSFVDRCSFAFDPRTGIVQQFAVWPAEGPAAGASPSREAGSDGEDETDSDAQSHGEEAAAPVLKVHLREGRQLAVHTDLALTGILIFAAEEKVEIFTNINAFLRTATDLLKDIVRQHEVKGNFFAIDLADRASMVCPLTSLYGYIAANQLVSARYLFPMTREANFGEVGTKYAVSRKSPLVSIPTAGCPELVGATTGSCTFGLETAVPVSSRVTSSIFADRVRLGAKVTVKNCVIGSDVTIGDGCNLVNCLVLSNVAVNKNSDLQDCIVGRTPNRIVVGQYLPQRPDQRSAKLEGSHAATTAGLFQRDIFGNRAESVSDVDVEDSWLRQIDDYVCCDGRDGAMLRQELKNLRLSFTKDNTALLEALMRRLVAKLDAELNTGADWDDVAGTFASIVLHWDRTVFWHFAQQGTTAGAWPLLRGLCCGVAEAENDLLREKGGYLLGQLYCNIDEQLYDDRDYCIVPLQAMFDFEAKMQAILAACGDEDEDDEDGDGAAAELRDYSPSDVECATEAWAHFQPYVTKVHEAMEEGSDEDDEDDEDDE